MSLQILIPSKGRAGRAKCVELLLQETCDFWIVVEPQEADAYRAAYPRAMFFTLEENNRGITYVRNSCLDLAGKMGFKWFWMLDDDINTMGVVSGGRVTKHPFTHVLAEAQKTFASYESQMAIGALEYQQYAWAAKKPYAFNSYCDTCVCLNYDIMKRFRYAPDVKEDRDMVLQVLSAGYITARTTRHCFGSPKNGSNQGGLQDAYKAGLEQTWSANMVKKWPGLCQLQVKSDGRPDVKINWGAFKATRPPQ